jgi:hypothetical protein
MINPIVSKPCKNCGKPFSFKIKAFQGMETRNYCSQKCQRFGSRKIYNKSIATYNSNKQLKKANTKYIWK